MIRRVLLIAVVAAVLGPCAAARAQGPAYSPSPPTNATWYRDGPDGRYLLGGTWLYRPDTGDFGIARGWWLGVASTDGWSPVTIPNADKAGDDWHPGRACSDQFRGNPICAGSGHVHLSSFSTETRAGHSGTSCRLDSALGCHAGRDRRRAGFPDRFVRGPQQ